MSYFFWCHCTWYWFLISISICSLLLCRNTICFKVDFVSCSLAVLTSSWLFCRFIRLFCMCYFICYKDHFTFSISVSLPLFLLVLARISSTVLNRIRGRPPCLSLISGGKHSDFHHWVWCCRFCLDLLFQIEEGPSVPILLRGCGVFFIFCSCFK